MAKRFWGIADLTRVWRAATYSLAGLRAAVREETAFRQELALFIVLAPLGLWLGQSGLERALLVGSLLLVLIAELLNSALEAVVNRIGSEPHPLSGMAKDMGSAAVFLAMMLVLVVWMLILGPRLSSG